MTIEIYTDGGSRGNPGIGGWGVVLYIDGQQLATLNGSADNTTNNRMEMTAAIEALKYLLQPSLRIKMEPFSINQHLTKPILLMSDSEYLCKGMTQWLPLWKAKGWRTSSKTPVKNIDLWTTLDALAQELPVVWRWVKGHANVAGNILADKLANQAMDELLAQQGNDSRRIGIKPANIKTDSIQTDSTQLAHLPNKHLSNKIAPNPLD